MTETRVQPYVCPSCLGPLEHQFAEAGPATLNCAACGVRYGLADGVPILIPPEAYECFPVRDVKQVYERVYAHADTMGTKFDPEYSRVTKTVLLELAQAAPNWRLLDVGTGDGDLWAFAPDGAMWHGIDLSETAIRSAVRRFPTLWGAVALCEWLPYPDSYFGAVLAVDTIEHTFDIARSLASIKRVLVKGGIFAFSVPTPDSLRKWGYNRLLRAVPSPRLVFGLIKTVLHRMLLFGTPCFQPIDRDLGLDDWLATVRAGGFNVVSVQEWPTPPLKPIVYLIAAEVDS